MCLFCGPGGLLSFSRCQRGPLTVVRNSPEPNSMPDLGQVHSVSIRTFVITHGPRVGLAVVLGIIYPVQERLELYAGLHYPSVCKLKQKGQGYGFPPEMSADCLLWFLSHHLMRKYTYGHNTASKESLLFLERPLPSRRRTWSLCSDRTRKDTFWEKFLQLDSPCKQGEIPVSTDPHLC